MKKNTWILILVFPVSFFTASLWAQTVLPTQLDLPQSLALAKKHSPSLKRLREQLREQDGVIAELISNRNVKFNLIGNGTEIDDNRLQAFGDFTPETSSWNAGAEARITVFSGGRSMMAIKSRRQQRQSFDDRLAAAEQQLLADIYEAYFNAQLASEKILVQEEVLRVLGEQRKFTQNRIAAGVGEPFDALQAEVALANARPDLIRAQNAYRRNVDSLQRLIGLPLPRGVDTRAIRLVPNDLMDDLPFGLDGAIQHALEFRPELAELDALEEAARLQFETVRREQRPLVDLFADYGAQSDDFGAEDYLHGWKTGVQVTMPIGDGGKTKGRMQQADALLQQVRADRESQEIALSGEVRQAFYDYEEAESILATSGQVTEQAEEALRLAKNRYQAGKGTQLDLLEAQLQLTESLVEDVTALNTLQRALVKIKRASGIELK